MSKSKDAIVETLKSKGLRVTPQRYAVYANLLNRTDHPTVEQLLHSLNQDFPMSSQATIYSSLQALREVGLVREVLLEEGVSRYDAKVSPHHHFYCSSCHGIHDIPWEAFPPLSLNSSAFPFEAESYEVTVRGVCDQCSETKS